MSEICVIIPAYGFQDMTNKCVDNIRSNAGMDVDILVVDDGSKEPIKIDNATVLRLNVNTGFTNATNQGILWCGDRYKYVFLANNDITPDPDFIKVLYDHMEVDTVVGIAGSARWKMDNGRKTYTTHGADLIRGYYAVSLVYDETPIYCDWFPICSALIRMKMIREIGILDKRFKQYCSDSEYCMRANLNGWNVAVLPKSLIRHEEQVTLKVVGIDPEKDQLKLLEKLAGMGYQKIMNRLPLDVSRGIWGKVTFEQYKQDKTN